MTKVGKCTRCTRGVDIRDNGKPYKLCEIHRARLRVADARKRISHHAIGLCSRCANPVSVKFDDTLYRLCDVHRTNCKLRQRRIKKEAKLTFRDALISHMKITHGYNGLPFIPNGL